MSDPQSTTLRLTYYGHECGLAQVDRTLADLIPRWLVWGVELPDAVRLAHRGRPDILLAMLHEDSSLLVKCHPFCQTYGLVIRLNRLALRPKAAEALVGLTTPTYRASSVALIRSELSSISRVSHVNHSRVDCRLSNLREVSPPETGLDDIGSHPTSYPPQPPFSLRSFFDADENPSREGS